MDNKFQLQKENAKKSLKEAQDTGDVDLDMLPVIDALNGLPDYYTTSTCTGRTSLFFDPGGKLGSSWTAKWHREVGFEEVLTAMDSIIPSGKMWFMHEPTIMHIVARDLSCASRLVDHSRNYGYKKAGILSCKEERVLVEICGTERIDAPVAENGIVLVSGEYLKYLAVLANEKFRKGMQRLHRFEKSIEML